MSIVLKTDSSHTDSLGSAPILRLLLRMSTPAIIAMSATALYNLVDTIFVGRAVGAAAIGALVVAFPVQIAMLACGLMIGIGSSSIISRALGANMRERAGQATGTAITLSIGLALIVSGVGLATLDRLPVLFGATEDLIGYTREYLGVILLGAPFVILSLTLSHTIRAEGDARRAMILTLLGAGLNILLDPLFIFVFGMGVRGAAVATVIAQGCSFLYGLLYYMRGRSSIGFSVRHLWPRISMIGETISIGIANFMRQFAGSVLIIIINRTLNVYGSTLYISVFGIVHKLTVFAFLPLIGIAQGLMPIVGYNYGAHSFRRVRETLLAARRLTLAFAAVTLGLVMVAPGIFLSIFTSDSQILEIGRVALRLILLVVPLLALQISGAIFFQAIGKALPALLLSMSREVIFLLPLVLILPRFFGATGVWIAFPIADLLATTCTMIWLAHELRRLRAAGCAHEPHNWDNCAQELPTIAS